MQDLGSSRGRSCRSPLPAPRVWGYRVVHVDGYCSRRRGKVCFADRGGRQVCRARCRCVPQRSFGAGFGGSRGRCGGSVGHSCLRLVWGLRAAASASAGGSSSGPARRASLGPSLELAGQLLGWPRTRVGAAAAATWRRRPQAPGSPRSSGRGARARGQPRRACSWPTPAPAASTAPHGLLGSSLQRCGGALRRGRDFTSAAGGARGRGGLAQRNEAQRGAARGRDLGLASNSGAPVWCVGASPRGRRRGRTPRRPRAGRRLRLLGCP